MRGILPLFLVALGSLVLGCTPDKPTDPIDTAEGDTDTDTDADGDTDTDMDAVGNDIASAMALTYEDGGAVFSDVIDYAGDRDFYFIQPPQGNMVMAYTASYAIYGEVVCDTVVRVYDSTGAMITENDDMPYRIWETDSGTFFQATDPDGYYVEVLEWSDWDPSSSGADGGPSFEYTFATYTETVGAYEQLANDTKAEADIAASDEDKIYLYYLMFENGVTQFFGEIETPGDVDLWPMEFDADSFGYWQWSFWPTTYGELEPQISLYDEDWNLLAQSYSPGIYPTFNFLYDAGITYHVTEAGMYYLEVRDLAGNGGAGEGYMYPGVFAGYNDTLATAETEDNQPTGLANTVSMTESSNTPGYFYGRFSGVLDVADASDNFRIRSSDVDGLDGKYVSVYLETDRQGSLLDSKLTVYADNGDGTFAELDTASMAPSGDMQDSPEIWDLELDSDANIYFAIEHENASEVGGPGDFYHGIIVVYDEPVN